MELGVHLPLMPFGDEPLGLPRLLDTVAAAREHGFAAVSANDHFLFQTPWLDGPTALAAVIERSGDLELATTVALAGPRHPVPLAKTLAALDLLSEGRLTPALGPGSSARDYEAVGVAFDERWKRFDEAAAVVRALLHGDPPPPSHFYAPPADIRLDPPPTQGRKTPVWLASWGSPAGLARVKRLGDGWLASAYNTTPDQFAAARSQLPAEMPNALATMWTRVTDTQAEADRVLETTLAPLLRRDPEALRSQVCVGPPEHCTQLLRRYAQAGCGRVYLWALGDERRQLERIATTVAPQLAVSA